MPHFLRRVASIGALYPAARRGLTADIVAAEALGLQLLPVCTALAMATPSRVSDFVEVPQDAVASQLQHITEAAEVHGAKLGVLAQHGTARTVLDWAANLNGPVVLDLHISGPAGETVLSQRGLDEVVERLGAPDLLLLDRTDAELVSGTAIGSLDDVQVAAQRIVRRGARSVVIKAGVLPARHFETEASGNGAPERFAADLFFDGREFFLFEAPSIDEPVAEGASSLHSLAILAALLDGANTEQAIRSGKATVTDYLRGVDKPIGSARWQR